MNATKLSLLILCTLSLRPIFAQQVYIDVNLDVKHSVGGIESFDRKKFVTIHADAEEREWDGDNFTPNLRNEFLNGYDVFMSRTTGGITYNLNNNINEDPTRPGFAKPSDITSRGASNRNSYGAKTNIHAYEYRNDQILAAQLHPFWPDGQKTNKGWAFSQTDTETEPFGTATGEYMGRYINAFYGNGGTSGQPRPNYVEVINEPLWHLVDYGVEKPEKVFRFHSGVAKAIRQQVSDIPIGGYCTAFPDFDKNDFKQWEERWKLFIDIAGKDMDFWTIHLYDFPSIGGGKQMYRKGSNMEATLDMMEQYSFLKFGKVKPIMVSEYGAQMHDYFGAWSAYRDWLHLKSVNSMMMQFMERPDKINKTMNFLIVKAEWGTTGVDDTYNHRLLRKENEPVSYTGKWVYTDMVKTYQLWSDVKGTRVDSKSSDLDVLTDTYIDGNKVYVILNNLAFTSKPVSVIGLDIPGNPIQQTKVKHLYLKGNAAALDETILDKGEISYNLAAEGTIIVEYTYTNNIAIDESSEETKYYADTYYKPIAAQQAETFKFNGVSTSTYGEATLRVGVGRDHGKSLKPTIVFNGTALEVPDNFRGGNQKDRDNFFGVLEIPIPYQLLTENNVASVSFPDNGGHISTVTMRVFNYSRQILRTGEKIVSIELDPKEKVSKPGKSFKISTYIIPESATDKRIIWASSNPIVAGVDTNGIVTTRNIGTATIIASNSDNTVNASCALSVSNDAPPVLATSIHFNPTEVEMTNPGTLLLEPIIEPMDVDEKTLTWESNNPDIATVDDNGLVTAVSEGKARIKATTNDGSELSATAIVTVPRFKNYVLCDMVSEQLPQTTSYTFKFPYAVGEEKDILLTLTPLNGFTALAEQRVTVQKGTDTATITLSLDEVLPTGDYNVWARVVKVGGSWLIATSTCSKAVNIDKANSIIPKDISTFSIYPNPVQDKLWIKGVEKNAVVKTYSYNGILLEQKQLNKGDNSSISMERLKKGNYILQINDDERTQTFKVNKR